MKTTETPHKAPPLTDSIEPAGSLEPKSPVVYDEQHAGAFLIELIKRQKEEGMVDPDTAAEEEQIVRKVYPDAPNTSPIPAPEHTTSEIPKQVA